MEMTPVHSVHSKPAGNFYRTKTHKTSRIGLHSQNAFFAVTLTGAVVREVMRFERLSV